MARVELDDGITYYMNDKLKQNITNKVIPSLQKKDKDFVMGIDGGEGTGKSTLAFQIGRAVDPTLNLSRITFNADEFRNAIYKAKKGQCVIYDEAFTGLSSRSSLSGINRALVSLMMQMRQKNLFVIIVLPTFFLLDKYVALFRTRALIHVYESSGKRGYFKIYNRKHKKLMYLYGKQTYSYNHKKINTRFKGRFYGVFALGDDKVEQEYRKKKARALEETEKPVMSNSQFRYMQQRDLLIYLLKEKYQFSLRELSRQLKEQNIELSHDTVTKIYNKVKAGLRKVALPNGQDTGFDGEIME